MISTSSQLLPGSSRRRSMAPLGVDIAVVGGGLGGLALAVGERWRSAAGCLRHIEGHPLPHRNTPPTVEAAMLAASTPVGLRRRGLDAHVFEAAPELRTATSTMIGLAKNAFQVRHLAVGAGHAVTRSVPAAHGTRGVL